MTLATTALAALLLGAAIGWLAARRRREDVADVVAHELVDARAELERHAHTRHSATQLNDTVVQGLVLAKYALERGDSESALALVERALADARLVINELLGNGDVEPGRLRRDAAAGIGDEPAPD